MSFLRHDEIYRSDGGMKTILSLEPGAASRWSAPSHDKGRGLDPAPFPSSAMSLGSAIPWRGALQHCPPPLHRPESMVYPPVETVNHHLTGAGELSTGDLRNFHPALTGCRFLSWASVVRLYEPSRFVTPMDVISAMRAVREPRARSTFRTPP